MSQNNPAVALVTGASSGIGRATAIALQAAGYRVFGTSRRAASDSADQVRAAFPPKPPRSRRQARQGGRR
jgi:NAD(P)-dependent dehydrogenase (short-subunit alcohol dehydrogenase family)